LFRVLRLQSGIKFFGIDYSLIFTGIPHHIDSLIIESAFSLINLRQYHLYSNVIDGRLIPLMHKSTISNRTLSRNYISDYDIKPKLNEFIENKKLNKPPSSAESVQDWRVIYFFSVIYLIYLTLKRKLQFIYSKITKVRYEEKLLDSLYELNFFTHLRLYRQQKKSLKFYALNIISNKEYKDYVANKDAPPILIMAHYQPEATSFPEGGKFGNHIDIVLELRRSGFKGEILYKEHKASYLYCSGIVGPSQVGMSRSISYYKQLLSLGCKFVNPDITLDINNALSEFYLPVTITGTVAIERSLFGFQTIVTGNPWFSGLPGILTLDNLDFALAIDYKYCNHNNNIEKEAYNFFIDQLNNYTITNAPGIGSGRKVHSAMTIFCEEIQILINNIEKQY